MNTMCSAITRSGSRCRAKPLHGSDFCYYHDPGKKEERKAASAAGGRGGTLRLLPPESPQVPLRSLDDVDRLIEATVNQVLRGQISHQISNSVATHIMLFLKSTQLRIVTERLSALEALKT